MVFSRLRLPVVATVMRAPGPARKDASWLRRNQVESKDGEACSFDCIVSIFSFFEERGWRARIVQRDGPQETSSAV